MSENTSKASPEVRRPVSNSQHNHARQRPDNSPGTYAFPSKNRSRISAQRWVEKCDRSITNSETPQQRFIEGNFGLTASTRNSRPPACARFGERASPRRSGGQSLRRSALSMAIENSPSAATFSPHWWPSFLPAGGHEAPQRTGLLSGWWPRSSPAASVGFRAVA